MLRIDLDDPEVEIDYDQRLLYRGEPFAGEVEEFLAGPRVSLVTYRDGFRDGPFREWYKSGAFPVRGAGPRRTRRGRDARVASERHSR